MNINYIISIVSPVFNAKDILPELTERIKISLEGLDVNFEVILVDDGSADNSWETIKGLSRNDPNLKGIKLSRNFGQHHAITAGIDHAKGEWIIVMDCDLQDRPEEIPKLYAKALEGFDIVLAKRHNRQDNFLKKLLSKAFHKVLSYLTGTNYTGNTANFGIYHTKVIHVIRNMKESIRYFPTMVRWVGFKSTEVSVKHAKREAGNTTYNLKRLINLALDIILAHSDKPIKLTVKIGLIIALSSFIFAIIIFIRWMIDDYDVLGYPSLIFSIWFLSGCILTTLGIVGLYIGKTFEQVKKRPLYIIEEAINY